MLAEKWVRVRGRAVSRGGEEGSCLTLLLAEKWVRVRGRAVSRGGEEGR